jgi:hypothetical protein
LSGVIQDDTVRSAATGSADESVSVKLAALTVFANGGPLGNNGRGIEPDFAISASAAIAELPLSSMLS